LTSLLLIITFDNQTSFLRILICKENLITLLMML